MSKITFTLEGQAAEANKWFIRDKRNDGKVFVKVKDGAPEWVKAMCMAAHDGGKLPPDDWRYEFIEDALCQLECGEEHSRDLDEAYPYTHDRLDWLVSHSIRVDYCDEAREEYGSNPESILLYVALGMEWEMGAVFDLVKAWLEKYVEQSNGQMFDAEEEKSIDASLDESFRRIARNEGDDVQ